MKRWVIPLLFLLFLVGCAPTIVQSVGSRVGQNQVARPAAPSQPDTGSAPQPAPPVGPTPDVPDLPPFEMPEEGSGDTEEHLPPAPMVPEEDLRAAARSNNAFALDLLGVLRAYDPGENIIYSPVSIYTAFAMLYAGAAGPTAAQLGEVLHFDLDPGALHPALGALQTALTPAGHEGFTLNIANAIWGKNGMTFSPPFLETLERYYGAALRSVDFAGDPAGAANAVNRWVNEATHGKIPEILGQVEPNTALVLANAIYFDAQWTVPFEAGNTRPAPFAALDGTVAEVDLMAVTERFAYAGGDDYQVVALPYEGGTARMVLILPAAGQFVAFEESLTVEQLDEMLNALDAGQREVALSMPKFEYETTSNLVDALGRLGLTLPFSGDADLSGINGQGGLAVDQAIHKARITVDEAGTEAAAATAIVAVETSLKIENDPVTMTVDRPFMYLVQDTQTGAFLFVGRVVTLN